MTPKYTWVGTKAFEHLDAADAAAALRALRGQDGVLWASEALKVARDPAHLFHSTVFQRGASDSAREHLAGEMIRSIWVTVTSPGTGIEVHTHAFISFPDPPQSWTYRAVDPDRPDFVLEHLRLIGVSHDALMVELTALRAKTMAQ